MNPYTIRMMTDEQQIAYMETHPDRDVAYDRILADLERRESDEEAGAAMEGERFEPQ